MTDKKSNIKDGKNIELDGVTVINEGISLVEKETKEEVAVPETPDTTEDKKEESVVENSVSLPEINIPEVSVAPEIPIAQEIPVDAGMPTFDINSQPNQVKTPNYNENEVKNFEPQTENTFDFNNATSIKTKSVIGNRQDVENLKIGAKDAMSGLIDEVFKPVEDEMDLLTHAYEIISAFAEGQDKGLEFYKGVDKWLKDYKGVQEVEEPYTSEYDIPKSYGDDENSYTGYDKVA